MDIINNINDIINTFQPYITIGLVLLVIILLIIVIVLLRSVNSLEKKYRKFMRGSSNKNLEELVLGYLDKIDDAKEETQKLSENYNELNNKVKECIQKTAIIRYRAFENVGSDLSFSIALLNGSDNGIILSGIYGRNESTTYAKPIDKGISRYDLSEEEQQVLREAMSK